MHTHFFHDDLPGWAMWSLALSWTGAILAKLGTLNDWALYLAIGHTLLSISYLIYKWVKGK